MSWFERTWLQLCSLRKEANSETAAYQFSSRPGLLSVSVAEFFFHSDNGWSWRDGEKRPPPMAQDAFDKGVFLISVCRAKFGESRNLEKMIGTPPLDDQMNISLQKNVLNSLQPPKTASTGPKFCCSQKDSFLKGSFRCSPNHIQHWNMECHTPLERSRIAFYGYVNFWSPNQTIWWPGAFEGFWR